MSQTVYLGADHAGFHLKEMLREDLERQGYAVEDLGAHSLDPNDDYPYIAEAVSEAVLAHKNAFGILLCGNAQGVCIAANKFNGIRAGTGFSIPAAKTMREDDHANVLCLPGRIETLDDPLTIAKTFLETPESSEPRHKRRLTLIEKLERL